MNPYVVVKDIDAVIAQKVRVPTTVMWNRLEGRPRRADFTRALKAEVRDPLWLLTRQWQTGEFIGDDAGSPVGAKAAWSTDGIAGVHTDSGLAALDPDVPLDAMAEARPVDFVRGGRPHNVDLRLALGRQWRRMLSVGHAVRVPDFLAQYPFKAPDPAAKADFPITAHAQTWQTLAALAGRAIDGGSLLLHLRTPGARASDHLGLVDPEKQKIDDLGDEFLAWAERLYFQPPEDVQAWQPRHLEYQLQLSAPQRDEAAALDMPAHRGGRVDWFSFDAVPATDADAGGARVAPTVVSFMPTTIHFDGMPNTRHWAFEEGAVNFGAIDPDTTDIAKLLLIDFGLLFANDWFMLPIELPVGSLTRIQGLEVTNTFGERFWIEPAVTAASSQAWQMFRHTPKGAADDRLVIPPASFVGQESQPVESVACVRDEVSNMVWGIETVVQLPDGSSSRGRGLALELHARFQSAVASGASPPPTNDAKIAYTLMRSVAENWIPFIPTHVDNDNREIQLQRAAMPRLLDGEQGVTPAKIAPRTRVLREGLDANPAVSYFLAEEEVERSGTVVETRWQRTRWWQGRVVLWQGHYRTCGRGETASTLAFDIVTPKIPAGALTP
ncbi:MAG TPA: hypothetical protein VGQ27_14830 [Steroidobacteraceae bacterium]|nr:hypothetical protein [Steroidobacteraceae bacterium]